MRVRVPTLLLAVLLSVVAVPSGGAAEEPTCDGTFHRAHFQRGPNRLDAIDFSAPDDGWAVGFEYDSPEGGPEYPFVVHYDGQSWSEFPGPARQKFGDIGLRAVSALAPDQVWVSAARWMGPRMHAYIRLWDGEGWRDTGHPDPGDQAYIVDVDAITRRNVWAVGYTWRDNTPSGLALRYNGDTWRRFRLGRRVDDVDGSIDSDVWAVGGRRVWRYDEGAWTSVRMPNYFDTRRSVSFQRVHVGPKAVWVLAYRDRPEGTPWVSARWDGSDWDITRMPDVPGGEQYYDLDGVRNDLWAVGARVVDGERHRALAVRWSGGRWVRVPVDPSRHELEGGVAVPKVGEAWAVSYSIFFHACPPAGRST